MKRAIKSFKVGILTLAMTLGMMNRSTVLAVDSVNLPSEVGNIKQISLKDFSPVPQSDLRFKANQHTKNIETLSAGDQYEPNDSIAQATEGVQGKVVSATINSTSDVDYYRFEVVDHEPLSILLYNIPTGCDYDLYLFNYDQSQWYTDFKDGSAQETFYFSLEDLGTYYVAVASNSGSSSSPYSLYFGKSIRVGSTDWIDPKLSFAFGNVPRGSTKTSLVKNINLKNDSSIPDGAVVTEFYLNNEGSGGTYAGFYKYLKPASGNIIKQPAPSQNMVVPANTSVKQNWQIWGSVEYSNYFTWEPRYYIQYEFFVTPKTTKFL